ncbi:MAG: TlpA family protein disulfide reductase [Candidatus Eisenbacteria bacterium]|nr:TlpA family protein disulfide reductase [Candidatus Eisenbacteria bacterium]
MHVRFVLPVLILCALPFLAAAGERAPADSTLAPRFHLPSREGTVDLDSLRGKTVYVDFWASWCGPCRASFPFLATLHARYASKGLAVVAINVDKDRGAAETFLRKYPAPFTIGFDPAGSTPEAYDVSVMPSSFLVSPEGILLHSHQGFAAKDTAALEARIREALPR